MNNETKKEENPLFPIARKLHNEHFLTWDYDFLHMTPESENTFILGFCGGVSHASGIFSKQISELQKSFDELEVISAENEKKLRRRIIELEKELAPTINRYAVTGIDDNQNMELIN